MTEEIKIAGIGIAPEVLSAIVSRAVEEVEGIATVGVRDIATNLVSMLSSKNVPAGPAVECSVVDEKLAITYPFKKLAESIREATAKAIDAQVGVEVESVDVCIDGLVFPKE